MKSRSYRADNENITKICFQKDKYFMSAYIWKLFKIQKTPNLKIGTAEQGWKEEFYFHIITFLLFWNFCIYIYIYMCVLLFKFKIFKKLNPEVKVSIT